ncbi:MAG: TonB-dependent receptor [Bryobacteraceae bacterium]
MSFVIVRRFVRISFAALVLFAPAYAQFSSSLEGTVEDPSGGAVAGADLELTNLETNVTKAVKSDSGGNYRFLSLAPGAYRVDVSARGFAQSSVRLTLRTAQLMNLPVKLLLSKSATEVTVNATAPELDTSDSRSQMTLTTQAISALPLAGRNLINLVTLTPGVEGTGTVAYGSPGSAVDNFSTETQVDASANGRSSVANMYIIDGIDITSNVRNGVLNVVPSPDSIQEAAVQTNTFSVEYGRVSSIQMVMTTKSGSDAFHGNASDYFTYQGLWAGTEFVHNYSPFHSNNLSGTIGGPISRSRHAYFFFSIEPLRSSSSTGNGIVTYEDPQFVDWAQQNFPNTLGTQLLAQFPPAHATTTGVSETAANIFPGTCGTAATANIPCALPMVDTGVFNSTNYRNGLQYNIRGDKYFGKDRVYANYYSTTLDTGGGTIRPGLQETDHYYTHSIQGNETHTFSPNILNEATFGYYHVVGLAPETGDFKIPVVNVSGQSTGIGDGFAQGDFYQHNYHWRDVLTTIIKTHELKAGYEGWKGDDAGIFQGPYSQPSFTFTNLLNLVEDHPYSEGSLAFNPLTGQPAKANYGYAGTTAGAFVQDTWKTTRSLTLTLGLRYDDMGNPHNILGNPLANFVLGPGQTFNEEVANGIMVRTPTAFNHSPMAWSPRIGIAWDPTHQGNWVVRGGFGVYHDWINIQNALGNQSFNPPSFVVPSFLTGTTTAPVFGEGTSNTYPYGFPYPSFPAIGLDAHGGLAGEQIGVGAMDPNTKAPNTYNYTANLERRLGSNLVASVGYSGSRSTNLLVGSGNTSTVQYGQDINRFAGDLIQNNDKLTRLNPSFGAITYGENGAKATYNAFITSLTGRWGKRGFVTASYTRSGSRDDSQIGPTTNFQQYWGPSSWDAPNRFSLGESYLVPAIKSANPLLKYVTGGWELASTTILQSGLPYTVYTSAPFEPIFNAQGNVIGMAPGSGDYNADGYNYDFPNAPSSGYTTPTSRRAYLNGVLSPASFGIPQMGTEGNELFNRFRGPGFAETDFGLLKNQPITERVNLQLRLEFYNLFNHPNLTQVDSNLADSSFGKVTGQLSPRWIQIGANLSF